MLEVVLLTICVIVFLIATLKESSIQPQLTKGITNTTEKLPIKPLLALSFGTFILTILLIVNNSAKVLSLYFNTALSLLIVAHAKWITLNSKLYHKRLIFLAALTLITLHILFPNPASTNLFVIATIVWVGPFLTKLGLLTRRRFIILSLLWLLYDSALIWLTPIGEQAVKVTETLNLPLFLTIGTASIGIGDLLWANLLISLIRFRPAQSLAIFAIGLSCFILLSYAFVTHTPFTFPLLTVWIPLGVIILQLVPDIKSKTTH